MKVSITYSIDMAKMRKHSQSIVQDMLTPEYVVRALMTEKFCVIDDCTMGKDVFSDGGMIIWPLVKIESYRVEHD